MKQKKNSIKSKLRNVGNQFRHAKGNKVVVSGFFVLSLVFTGIGLYQFNQPATSASNECNTNDIVRSGTHNQGDIARHYQANVCGDFRAIYDHYWIKPDLAPGDRVFDGQSNNKGEVIADGRVVARNAASIGRHAIQHSQPISIAGKTYYQTSHVGGRAFANPNASLPTLVVLDGNGNFKYAIVKDCANPIYATPVEPPKPPEPPKPVVRDIQVCELASKRIITIKEDQFNPEVHSRNLEDCQVVIIEVCEVETGRIIKIDEDDFDGNKHSRNLEDCIPRIEVCELETDSLIEIREDQFDETKHSRNFKDCVKMQVCELETKEIITIRETEFDENKHSTNLQDCETAEEIVVCDLENRQIITITEEEFDEARHTRDLKECEAKCPIPGFEHLPAASPECAHPVELPKTGATSLVGAGVGFAALGLSTHYYLLSRRNI